MTDELTYETDTSEPEKAWECFAESFYYDAGRRNYYAEHDLLNRWTDELKPQSILQVGIGFGRELKPLISRPYVKKVVGVDISKKMIEFAREWLGNPANVEFMQKSICDKLPFENKSFDLAFTMACLTHVPGRCITNALSELLRVGKKVINIELFWAHCPNKSGNGVYEGHIGGFPPAFSYDYPTRYRQLGATVEKTERVHGATEYFCIQTSK